VSLQRTSHNSIAALRCPTMAKVPPPLSKVRTGVAVHDAIVLLEADASQLHAALRIARYLIAEARPFLAAEVAGRLVDAFIRRGDLPRAVLAAHAAEEGTDETSYIVLVAKAFGEGSARLADAPPHPPPLPKRVNVPAKLAKLQGEALLDRGEAALQKYMDWDDPIEADTKLPRLPLFSDLEPGPLADLLGAFEASAVGTDEVLIAEGDEGTDAFVVADGVLNVSRRIGEDDVVLAALGPGAIFGEMALVSDAPRAATVRATLPSTVLRVRRSELEELAVATPEIGQRLSEFCRARMLSNLMRHSELLGAVPRDQREELVSRFETCHFEANDVLVEVGEEGAALYLIASGAVAVEGKDASGPVRIAELGPGEIVGEISLVLRRPANATVRVIHPTVALRLGRDEFQDAIKAHPTILAELYDTATGRDEETRSLVAQEMLDDDDIVLI
jgi:CRP-like cAMP-binding protein